MVRWELGQNVAFTGSQYRQPKLLGLKGRLSYLVY